MAGIGERDVGLSKFRIGGNRQSAMLFCCIDLLGSESIEVPGSPSIVVPRGEIIRRLASGPFPLNACQLGLDRTENGASDIVLNRKDVRYRAVVMHRPKLGGG